MGFVTGNPELDFFEQNPTLQYITEFMALREELGKKEVSKILWSIYMLEDPSSSIFRMPKADKIAEIKATYYADYDEEKYKDIARMYAKFCMEKEEHLYSIHAKKLDELTAFLDELSLTDDTQFNKYVKIMDKLSKIWESLSKVKKQMVDTLNKSELRGGAKRGAREKR